MSLLAAVRPCAAGDQVDCDVPFSFTVTNTTLPPGTYTVSSEAGKGSLLVRGITRGAFALSDSLRSEDLDARLVFHTYGDEYVLREVWMGAGTGRELPEPPRERELAGTAGRGQPSAHLEQVVVPAS